MADRANGADTLCTYPGEREEALISYVYDDMRGSERSTFELHLADCDVCRTELSGLGAVRTRLSDWAPPEPTRAFVHAQEPQKRRFAVWKALEEMPAWAQLAAAVLVLGVSAGAANLRITYNSDGLSVRTGWSRAGGDADVAQSSGAGRALVPDVTAQSAATSEPSATRRELVALERELREEIAKAQTIGPSLARETKALVDASERRQETELALRIGTMAQDLRAQREADNASLTRWVRTLGSNADFEARRTRDMVNTLATRVSTQSQQR